MKIKKIFNNNIILVEDDKLVEMVLLGKGIGFGLKAGDIADESKIEKKFKLSADKLEHQSMQMIASIPINHLELTRKIIDFAEKELDTTFDGLIFIGLADHISFAIKRAKANESLKNAMLWEIKKFYKKEFKVAMKVLDIIYHDEGIMMSEDEASIIAMHFVNGQQSGSGVQSTAEATRIIQDILNIVKYHFRIELDEDSISYSRFITHIRFFLQRKQDKNDDDFLFDQIRKKYPDTYECVLRIKQYLDAKLKINLNNEEMLYFMLHVKRLTDRTK